MAGEPHSRSLSLSLPSPNHACFRRAPLMWESLTSHLTAPPLHRVCVCVCLPCGRNLPARSRGEGGPRAASTHLPFPLPPLNPRCLPGKPLTHQPHAQTDGCHRLPLRGHRLLPCTCLAQCASLTCVPVRVLSHARVRVHPHAYPAPLHHHHHPPTTLILTACCMLWPQQTAGTAHPKSG